MNLEELRRTDRLIYYLPMEGEDDWWMSTHALVDHIGGTIASAHRRLIKYRDQGIVEQLREDSPKRPGRTRYFLDHDGARWRVRRPQAEQEHRYEKPRGGDSPAAGYVSTGPSTELSTEAHMLLDLFLQPGFIWTFSRLVGLSEKEVSDAYREVRQAVGREV